MEGGGAKPGICKGEGALNREYEMKEVALNRSVRRSAKLTRRDPKGGTGFAKT